MGISTAVVHQIALLKEEPSWLVQKRLEALEIFEELPMPSSRYTQVRGLKLSEIAPIMEGIVSAVPKGFEALFEGGEAAGLLIQADGQTLQATSSPNLKEKGVLFLDLNEALREHPDLVRLYFERLENPSDKIMALQRALFLSGSFLYVPKGVVIERPLKAISLLTRPGSGLFTQSFVIAEPESSVKFLEEFYSPGEFERPALVANNTLVHVGLGAQVEFAGLQDYKQQVFNFIRRLGRVEQEGRLHWALGWLGGRLTMSQVESVLDGPGAEVEDLQVFFTSGRQHFDLTSNLKHQKPHTRGEVNVKGVLKGQSRSVFWGLIRIEKGAQHANAFQSERSLILEDGPCSNAIPSLEIEANDVRCTHAASTSQIDQDQIFYLRSRGLTEEEAKKMIVNGFFEPLIQKIPLPLAQARMRMLIDRKWQSGA